MSTPVPGWYPDPAAPGAIRWWDGHTWTSHQAPMPRLLVPRPRPPLPPMAGRNAGLGTIGIVLHLVLALAMAAAFGAFMSGAGERWFDTRDLPDVSTVWTFLVVLGGIVVTAWVPLFMLTLWTYRCTRTAAALGIPASIDPLLGSISWIVPYLNFYFPYQALRECLPPDHPRRRRANLLFWIGDIAVANFYPVIGLAAVFGTVPYLVGLVLLIGLAVPSGVEGVRLARAIDAAHREALPKAGAEAEAKAGATTGS